mmetsp:Transcript_512/g.1283  ORF Transcript_512/g.1283 Transcript_512/m.1283 type:complete len:274 (+) Transcript_512:266-1087(+)
MTMTRSITNNDTGSAGNARKRHIAAGTDDDDDDDQNKRLKVVAAAATEGDRPKPHITGIKKQSRYDPGVPMTREELKAWRKEARRVRNRESAALSRKKNKERITELEMEVDTLQSKYAAALQFLLQREREGGSSSQMIAFVPAVLRQDLMDEAAHSNHDSSISRSSSPVEGGNSIAAVSVSPPLSPASSAGGGSSTGHEQLFLPPPSPTISSKSKSNGHHQHHRSLLGEQYSSSLNRRQQHSQHEKEQQPDHQNQQSTHHQHINSISRPIACV